MDLSSCHHALSSPVVYTPVMMFTVSLAGSLHCAGMCGGLVSACAAKPTSWIHYQLGRLVTYSTLGALAGGLGHLLLPQNIPVLSTLSTVFIAFVFIGMGLSLVTNRSILSFKSPSFISKTIQKLYPKAAAYSAFTVGALSGFLPCGWLYSMVLSVTLAKSPLYGALLMTSFWLGTLPALAISPVVLKTMSIPFKKHGKTVFGYVAILYGMITLGLKFIPKS